MFTPDQLEVTPDEWEWRKYFYGFDETDAARLKGIKAFAENFVHEVVNELYVIFTLNHETSRLISDKETLAQLKESQTRYFLELFDGSYNEDYLRQRLKIGRIHQQIGLDLEWYLGAYTHYIRLVQPHIMEIFSGDVQGGLAVTDSLLKLISLDQSLAVTAYMASKAETS